MSTSRSFTGRSRRRVTHARVRAADAIARAVITLGGIGTLVAVLLVGVFLFVVALPLFRGASAEVETVAALPATAAPVAIGTDPSGAVVWLVEPAGDLVLAGTADGVAIERLPAAASGLTGATAVRVLASGDAAVGFADGSFRRGRIGVESRFVDPAALPPAAARLARGATAISDSGAIVRGLNGHHAVVKLVSDLDEPAQVADAAIVDIDLTPLDGGWLIAALDAAGRVRIEAVTIRRNLLTDETVATAAGCTIEPDAGFTPRFVRVSELGDQAVLFAADGVARRYLVRDVTAAREMETFRAAPPGVGVVAVERLFGGAAFAVADEAGAVRIFFPARATSTSAEATADGIAMVTAREFPAPATAGTIPKVTALAAAPRSRLFAAADTAGGVRLLHSTAGSTVLTLDAGSRAEGSGFTAIAIAAREHRVVATGGARLQTWRIDPGYPEVGLASLLRPTWYERYPAPVHAWETTGHESFEPKYGLWPLIFGTIKATTYAMLFATPIAILAAIYASEFMHPRWRGRIKPVIELMAGLPSVVLGFVAGMVFAPWLETAVMAVIAGLVTVPLSLLAGAHLWQFLPAGVRTTLAGWRFAAVGLVGLPVGLLGARLAAPAVERWLFAGDLRGWLDGSGASGFGGWVIALVPLAAIGVAVVMGRTLAPWLRQLSGGWSSRRAAAVSLVVFLAGAVATMALACAAAVFLDSLRLDPRGGIFGTYVQRNALVVGIGMSFAIIPLIFTIADDALASVPDHLRSASLGAGATPWQTTVRVIVPAAASGIFSAVMIGLGRAVGETMIVLMAAGNTPILDWNIFNGFQTLSAAIATELPEAARGSGHYRVLFLAALALFAMTFVVNTAAELVRQRFRRRAHDL